MEIYNNLHESLQQHVHKMDMSKNVLPCIECQNPRNTCDNCVFHGFPCLNCAYDKYNGTLGPGFECSERTMFSNEFDEKDEEANLNMLLYILQRNPKVRILDNVFSDRPIQYNAYCEMHN